MVPNNRTSTPMETAYSTSVLKITSIEAISDAGAAGHFVLPGTSVKKLKPEIKPILIILLNGYRLMSTYV